MGTVNDCSLNIVVLLVTYMIDIPFHSLVGESSLHLAARYARAGAARILLQAGADANMEDKNGRTPLHAAVAADAQGAFQVRAEEGIKRKDGEKGWGEVKQRRNREKRYVVLFSK